jgi:hypothetical protein
VDARGELAVDGLTSHCPRSTRIDAEVVSHESGIETLAVDSKCSLHRCGVARVASRMGRHREDVQCPQDAR